MNSTTVFFKHYRYPTQMPNHLIHYSRNKSTWEPLPKGGETHCIVIRNGARLGVGIAQCGSKDNFCYRDGRLVAVDHFIRDHQFCPSCHRLTYNDGLNHTDACQFIKEIEGLSKAHRENLHLT